MSAQTGDLDRRARRVRVTAQRIQNTLARRPGALAPGERRDVLAILNAVVGAIPGLAAADPARQLDAAEGFLATWLELLNEYPDLAALGWMDPDTEDR